MDLCEVSNCHLQSPTISKRDTIDSVERLFCRSNWPDWNCQISARCSPSDCGFDYSLSTVKENDRESGSRLHPTRELSYSRESGSSLLQSHHRGSNGVGFRRVDLKIRKRKNRNVHATVFVKCIDMREPGGLACRRDRLIHDLLTIPARRQEIIKMTEQLIESINTGDFEAYT